MPRALTVVGAALVLIGLLWVGQGTGVFPYPSESFMIADMTWAWIGGVTAAVGVLLIAVRRQR